MSESETLGYFNKYSRQKKKKERKKKRKERK